MQAFLQHPGFPGLKPPSSRIAQICSKRRVPNRAAARILVSATTDEAPPLDGPPVPVPPPHRPDPDAPPPRPSSFDSSNSINPPSQRTSSFDPAQPRFTGDRPRPSRSAPRRPGPGPRSERSERSDRGPQRPPFVQDPKACYFTKCGTCSAAYEVNPSDLGRGRKVECAVCGNQWYQKTDRLMILKENQGFKDYPIEEKDEYIEKQTQARRERFRARNIEREGGLPRGSRFDRKDGRQREYTGSRQHSVFIGNLPFSCSQEQLEDLFRDKMTVNRVSIVRDPNGRSKGFAFADFSTEAEVLEAVDTFNGIQMDGRPLTVRVGKKN